MFKYEVRLNGELLQISVFEEVLNETTKQKFIENYLSVWNLPINSQIELIEITKNNFLY